MYFGSLQYELMYYSDMIWNMEMYNNNNKKQGCDLEDLLFIFLGFFFT
jgi:hypothetical protein